MPELSRFSGIIIRIRGTLDYLEGHMTKIANARFAITNWDEKPYGEGQDDGRTEAFVLQRIGVFESGQAKESYSVVPGSATGELRFSQ